MWCNDGACTGAFQVMRHPQIRSRTSGRRTAGAPFLLPPPRRAGYRHLPLQENPIGSCGLSSAGSFLRPPGSRIPARSRHLLPCSWKVAPRHAAWAGAASRFLFRYAGSGCHAGEVRPLPTVLGALSLLFPGCKINFFILTTVEKGRRVYIYLFKEHSRPLIFASTFHVNIKLKLIYEYVQTITKTFKIMTLSFKKRGLGFMQNAYFMLNTFTSFYKIVGYEKQHSAY